MKTHTVSSLVSFLYVVVVVYTSSTLQNRKKKHGGLKFRRTFIASIFLLLLVLAGSYLVQTLLKSYCISYFCEVRLQEPEREAF